MHGVDGRDILEVCLFVGQKNGDELFGGRGDENTKKNNGENESI